MSRAEVNIRPVLFENFRNKKKAILIGEIVKRGIIQKSKNSKTLENVKYKFETWVELLSVHKTSTKNVAPPKISGDFFGIGIEN